MSTPFVVQSLDLTELQSNRELIKTVGPQIAELADSPQYKLLVQIMQCEQRRRSLELVEKVGTADGLLLAAQLKELFTFNHVVIQILASLQGLIAAEIAQATEDAQAFDFQGDNVPS